MGGSLATESDLLLRLWDSALLNSARCTLDVLVPGCQLDGGAYGEAWMIPCTPLADIANPLNRTKPALAGFG